MNFLPKLKRLIFKYKVINIINLNFLISVNKDILLMGSKFIDNKRDKLINWASGQIIKDFT